MVSFTYAVKKHGKENFKREILEYCDSYDELLEKEKLYVNEKWVKDRSNYNAKTGGQSAGLLSDESKKKISDTLKEKYKNGEIIATIGERNKITGTWCKGLKMSDEQKKNFSKAAKKRFEDDKENHPFKLFRNDTISEDQKNKISNTLKEKYKNGEIIPNRESKSEDFKHKISETLKNKYKNEDHPSKGKPSWNKGKIMEKVECPHCGKFSDKSNAKRWHFDNCKLSILYKQPEYKPMIEECKEKISNKLKETYKNKEHHLKGVPSWNTGKIMKKVECPHCKKMTDRSNAKVHHFDNCKFKNKELS